MVRDGIVLSLLLASLWALVTMLAPRAEAVPAPPYGGCREVLQDYPAYHDSEGAAICRERGWNIRKHIVVNRHGYVLWTDMRPCPTDGEDRVSTPCLWNALEQGNKRGQSYWLGVRGWQHIVRFH